MRFTKKQYDQAIENLQLAKTQLIPDGECCAVCGDSGHMAFECGHNSLLAVAVCNDVAASSDKLHDALHKLAGYESFMGMATGPAAIHQPEPQFPDNGPSELD